jgi:RNase H-like domain found in reverse transcriptase
VKLAHPKPAAVLALATDASE